MGVRLVTASHPAGVRLVGGVDVHVLLPVAGVGEPPVAALHLAFEWLLTWRKRNIKKCTNDRKRGERGSCLVRKQGPALQLSIEISAQSSSFKSP